jgi:NADPH:quinone reductase-like Zn-dependent oxidoreductase
MLKSNGKLVSCGATTGPKCELDIRHVFWKQLQIIGSTMSNQGEFRDVMALVFEGKLKPVIDRVFPLERVQEAERYLVSANQFGKVLLKI